MSNSEPPKTTLNPLGPNNRQFKILIIDDEKTMAEVLAKRLMKKNFLVSVLADPLTANHAVKNYKPDLVLLDLKMPQLPGIECLKKLRLSSTKEELPIIMLTVEDSSSAIVECFEAGANDFIVKGSPLTVIVSRISALISVAELIEEKIRSKELKAIMALVASYNHEINNPLTVVLGHLNLIKENIDPNRFEKIEEALLRIQEVVGSLRAIGDKFSLEYENYTQTSQMLKLK